MEPSVPKVGVALFGVGRAGQYHLPTLADHPEVKVTWVVDVAGSEVRARELCDRYGVKAAQFAPADHCDVVFQDPGTAAVVVTTPTKFHEDITKRALRAGKHVFCEKPLSFTADAVRSCYAEAEQSGRVLFCGFNKRFDENHVEMREEVHSGRLGAARAVHYTWRDPATSAHFLQSYIPASGGIFCDSVIHQLDYVPWLLGEKPCGVVAVGGRTSSLAGVFGQSGDVDSAMVTLRFPSGAQAFIEVTREGPQDDVCFRLEVLGTQGTCLLHKEDGDRVCMLGMLGQEGQRRKALSLWSSYQHEMNCFIRVIQGKEECPVPACEVIQAHALADLCLLSLREGRVVDCSHL